MIALTAHHVNMYCAWSLVKEIRVWPPIGPPIYEVIVILVSKNIENRITHLSSFLTTGQVQIKKDWQSSKFLGQRWHIP